jgi:hypothetical protein
MKIMSWIDDAIKNVVEAHQKGREYLSVLGTNIPYAVNTICLDRVRFADNIKPPLINYLATSPTPTTFSPTPAIFMSKDPLPAWDNPPQTSHYSAIDDTLNIPQEPFVLHEGILNQ